MATQWAWSFTRQLRTLQHFVGNGKIFSKHTIRLSSTYRAAVLNEYGKALQLEDIKREALKKNEVRVAVHSCGVNASDLLMVENKYDHKKSLPFVPGCEVCGEIIEVGEDVSGLTPGVRVIALNKEMLGGFAEECKVTEKDVWVVDHAVSFDRGASLPDNYGTALLGLTRRAKIVKESTILVTAAAGGLGLAAVDLASNVYKAKVIGVCGTEDKADLVRKKGAWAAVKYNVKHLQSTVNEVTDGRGVDIIFDAVGGDVFTNCLPSVAHEGTVIVAGFASRVIPHIETSLLLPKAIALVGVSLSHYRQANYDVYREAVEDVIELHEMNLITPHVSATFSLSQTGEAFEFIRERKSTGKVVLEIR